MVEQSRAEPSRAGPSRAEPSRAEPSRAKPSRAGPGRAEPSRAEPSRADPGRAGPRQPQTAPDGPRTTLQSQFSHLRNSKQILQKNKVFTMNYTPCGWEPF
jgi:hypothetical protein